MKRAWILLLLVAVACATPAPPPPPQPVTETVAPPPPPPPPPDPNAFRATAPPAGSPRPYRFPDVERITLDNGLRVLVARRTNAPLATVLAVVRAGADHDPAARAGLASFTADMVDEGAGRLSAIQIAERMGNLGATLQSAASYDASVVSLDILDSQLEQGMEVFADVVRRPQFLQREFNRVKKDRLTTLLQQKDVAPVIATNRFAQFVYGGTAYGLPLNGTEATVEKITRGEMKSFYDRHWLPNNTSLIIVGNVDRQQAEVLARKHFSDWKRGRDVEDVRIAAPPIASTTVYLVDRPAAVQSEIRIGHGGVARSTEDYFPLLVMNSILGGQFTSRLNLNLREKHGYTYGAGSGFAFRRQPGPFFAGAAVRNAVTMESVRETVGELRRIGSGDITDQELKFSKDYLMGVFPARVETTSALAERIQELELYALQADYFERYRENIAAVTREDVVRVAKKYVDPDRAVILVVGKVSEVQAPLETLGYKVQTFDIEGRALPR
jgi:predicted Zn-dependent peptidase